MQTRPLEIIFLVCPGKPLVPQRSQIEPVFYSRSEALLDAQLIGPNH